MKLVGIALSSLALVACGGGADGGGVASTPMASTINGIAAVGLPMVNAHITVTDRTGKVCLKTIVKTDEDGRFVADTSECTAPLLVRAKGDPLRHDGVNYTWESVSVSNTGVINITPTTSTLLTKMIGGVPSTEWVQFNATSTPADVAKKMADAQADLLDAMRAANLQVPADFDLIKTPFAADGTGFDAILDGISVVIDPVSGDISVKNKAGDELFALSASTRLISRNPLNPTVWPSYYVFNNLNTSIRDLTTASGFANEDSTVFLFSGTSGAGTMVFTNKTHPTLTALGGYDPQSGGITPLQNQSGNERLNAQAVVICSSGTTPYIMISKTAVMVPLSEIINGAAKTFEQVGASEDCPLINKDGLTSYTFPGNGADLTFNDGRMTEIIPASEWLGVNSMPNFRIAAFKVSVQGQVRYGLIERGLSENNGSPFLILHVQN